MKNKYTPYYVIGLIVIVTLGFSLYGGKVTKKEEIFKVAVIAPLSGDFAPYGELVLSGVKEAFKNNPSIEIIPVDDMCDPVKAVAGFKNSISLHHVSAVVGPVCGAPQEAVAPLVKEAQVVTLLPSAAPKDVYSHSSGFMKQVQYSVEQESEFIAQTFIEKGYKKVALISYGNAFSQAHRKAFLEYSKTHNPQMEVIEYQLTSESSDISPVVLKIKKDRPDTIFTNDVSFFLGGGTAKLAQYSIKTPLYTQYAVSIEGINQLAKGAYYSYPQEITEEKGPVHELAKLSGEIIEKAYIKCGDDKKCLMKEVDTLGGFVDGIRKQTIIIKQIAP